MSHSLSGKGLQTWQTVQSRSYILRAINMFRWTSMCQYLTYPTYRLNGCLGTCPELSSKAVSIRLVAITIAFSKSSSLRYTVGTALSSHRCRCLTRIQRTRAHGVTTPSMVAVRLCRITTVQRLLLSSSLLERGL